MFVLSVRSRGAGVVRRAVVHRVHTEPVHDQRGPVLRHHQAAGVRREADAAAHAGVRVAGVAGRGVHQPAAGAHTGQRALDRGRQAGVQRVPELRVPDLRDARLVLHTADGHDHRVLQDIPGRAQDRAGGAPGAEPPGEQPLLPGDQRQERRGPGRVQDRHGRAGTGPARAPGQQQREHRDHGKSHARTRRCCGRFVAAGVTRGLPDRRWFSIEYFPLELNVAAVLALANDFYAP